MKRAEAEGLWLFRVQLEDTVLHFHVDSGDPAGKASDGEKGRTESQSEDPEQGRATAEKLRDRPWTAARALAAKAGGLAEDTDVVRCQGLGSDLGLTLFLVK